MTHLLYPTNRADDAVDPRRRRPQLKPGQQPVVGRARWRSGAAAEGGVALYRAVPGEGGGFRGGELGELPVGWFGGFLAVGQVFFYARLHNSETVHARPPTLGPKSEAGFVFASSIRVFFLCNFNCGLVGKGGVRLQEARKCHRNLIISGLFSRRNPGLSCSW